MIIHENSKMAGAELGEVVQIINQRKKTGRQKMRESAVAAVRCQ